MNENKMKNGCPCRKDCERREPGCHAVCNDYKTWKEADLAKKAAIRKEKERYDTLSETTKKRMWRKQRYKNQMKYNRPNIEDR